MKNPKIKPREYQRECLVAIDNAIANGEKHALVVMASGLGKTYTSAFAVEKYLADKRFARVLVLCHSEKILRQTKEKFQEYFGEEFSYGMYVNYDKATRPTNFLFATFQTMKDNRKEFPKDEFSYVIVDEAHHSHARTYFPTIRYFRPEFLLGLTATPDRLDGQKIEEIYGEPVYELGFVEATKRGLIAECDYRLVLDDLSQERLDEYLASDEKLSIKQLNRTLFIKKRDEEIVRLIGEYSAGVENPKTMIFCRTVEHARKIAKLIGDKAALAYKKNGDSANDRALKSFKEGEINTIISVDMLNEGIDVPDANVVVFLRNTVSPAVFYQQLGRGTRLSEGKDKVLVLDFVDNCERIKMILELKQEIDDFRVRPPHGDEGTHGDGDASSREKFALNIDTRFSIELIDIVSIFEKGNKWTKEEIIAQLQTMYRRDKKVTYQSIDAEPDMPSTRAVCRIFKVATLNDVLEIAKIPLNKARSVCISREEMLIEGRAMIGRGERITTRSVDSNPKLPMVSTIQAQFGTVVKFAALCGQETKTYSRDSLLEGYWLESKRAGHWLSNIEIAQNANLASNDKYNKTFSSRKDLINEIKERYGPINTEIDEAERLAKLYYEASLRRGHWLTIMEVQRDSQLPSMTHFRTEIGSSIYDIINFTRDFCGDLPEEMAQQPRYTAMPRPSERLIEEYWGESKAAGHWLSTREIEHDASLASPHTYYRRFKSLAQIRQLAIEAHGDFTKEVKSN